MTVKHSGQLCTLLSEKNCIKDDRDNSIFFFVENIAELLHLSNIAAVIVLSISKTKLC